MVWYVCLSVNPESRCPRFLGKLIEPIMGKNYGGSDVKVDWEKEVYCRNYLNHSIFEDFENEGFMVSGN